MDKLQRVLNAAARIITGTRKFDHCLGQILHDELHWLNVPDRVFLKLTVIVYRCLKTAALYCITCRITVTRPPVLAVCYSCVPATVNFFQYVVTCSILMVAGPFQLPAPQSGTLSRILSGPGFYPGPDDDDDDDDDDEGICRARHK